MNVQQVLLNTIDILNSSNFQYMITGGIATNYYGDPRLTHDVDLVIQLSRGNEKTVVNLLKDTFFIDEESIRIAFDEQSMFNVIHKEIGTKIDLWMLTDDEYDKVRFERKKKVTLLGKATYLPAPEDMIICKLDWYKSSKIDKHYLDALGIYRIQKENLDIKYIIDWVTRKSTLKIWQKIQE